MAYISVSTRSSVGLSRLYLTKGVRAPHLCVYLEQFPCNRADIDSKTFNLLGKQPGSFYLPLSMDGSFIMLFPSPFSPYSIVVCNIIFINTAFKADKGHDRDKIDWKVFLLNKVINEGGGGGCKKTYGISLKKKFVTNLCCFRIIHYIFFHLCDHLYLNLTMYAPMLYGSLRPGC